MSDGGGMEEAVVEELLKVVEPVVEAADTAPNGVIELLHRLELGELLLGEEIDKVVSVFENDLVEPLEQFRGAAEDPESALENPKELYRAAQDLVDGVETLSDLRFQSENVDDAGERVLDFLIVRYLFVYHRDVFIGLGMTGVVKNAPPLGEADLDFSAIPDLFTNPNKALQQTFNWGVDAGDLRCYLLLYYLYELLWEHSVGASFVSPSKADVETLLGPDTFDRTKYPIYRSDSSPDSEQLLAVPNTPIDMLRIPLLTGKDGNLVGTNLVPLPAAGGKGPGLALQPFGIVSYDESFDIAENWEFFIELQGDASWRAIVQPDSTGTQFSMAAADGSAIQTSIQTAGELSYTGAGDDASPLIGQSDGTNFTARHLSARTEANFDGEKLEIAVELPAGLTLVIKPNGGFLEQVFPESVTSEFDLTAGWSTKKGLYFEGGATLEIPIPIHESVGPLDIKEIFISLGADTETGEITVQAAASASVQLGPITGTVTRIGLETDLSFPENQDGNMGVVDLELGFKPPEGVGLDVSAGPVTGGGYLEFDRENERYAGTGQLTFPSGLSISVVGLITTELPDGSDGFSMMLVVAGEFSSVQLGFGFTLSGVGGMLGINRSFRKKPLQDVVRQGELENVLFPEDVVENAQRIISDVRSIFPPTRGSHVFGPMVKIGWGTPSIISASVGVVLEIPSFRIAILGQIEMALPNLEVERPEGMPEEVPFPPIQVNLDVVGIIDVPGKTLSIDASLYDSRILQWKMSGDMALRSSWGEQSRFMLSIGGFNPRYQPPKDFPALDPVKVSLDVPGGQPVVDFTGYMAVTSNTFQVGARVHAELEAGIVYVYGGLGFDALFRFDPFSFVFDFFANFGVEVKGYELSIGIDGTISGPTPFNIRGSVNLSIGPFDVSADIDVTLGSDAKTKQLPSAEVLPELVDALCEPKNWDAQLPGDGNAVATLRSARSDEARERAKAASGGSGAGQADAAQPVLAHPLGTLTVQQTVVPLNYAIEKFGEARPTTYDEFRIAGVSVGGVPDRDRQAVESEFAPAAFRKMGDAQKLDTPDFVDLDAGTTAGDLGLVVGGEANGDDATEAAFTYEEKVYDDESDHRGASLSMLDSETAGTAHTAFTAHELSKGKRGVQPESEGLFGVSDDGGDGGLFGVAPGDYVVVDVDTFEPVVETVYFDDGGTGESGGDGDSGGESDGTGTGAFVSVADSVEAERIRPGLHTGTSKGRAQVELKRYANETDVDERRLQVVSTASLEDDE